MGVHIKIDERAFNRGVDDVITLKPVRKAFGMVLKSVGGRSSVRDEKTSAKGSGAVVRRSRPSSKKER